MDRGIVSDPRGIALDAIHAALMRRSPPDLGVVGPQLARPGAAFVTLERDDELLGCVGSLEPVRPLAADIAQHAVDAAFADPRVPPITRDDYEAMSLKVSVLSPLSPLCARSHDELTAALRRGIDGVVVQFGARRATFLPSVWPKLPDVEAFVDALWRKAGLRPRSWSPGTRVATYTTVEHRDAPPRVMPG